jgi:hypothetical protein
MNSLVLENSATSEYTKTIEFLQFFRTILIRLFKNPSKIDQIIREVNTEGHI